MSKSNVASQLETPTHKMLQQAAEWFATISDEDVTEQQKSAWTSWLKQHPHHQEAWQYVENVGHRFLKASQLAHQDDVSKTLNTARTDRINRRQLLKGFGALFAAGWFSWRFTPLQSYTQGYTMAWRADHHTSVGETQVVTLQDGGQLWLNTASAVNINYQTDERQIELLAGEILIQTGADVQARPFIVNTKQGSLRALGTRFTVRQQDESTFLAVYDGAVKINTASSNTQIVQAGQQTTFTTENIDAFVAAETAREAWSKGLIVANNISLQALVAEVNRYQHGHLTVDPKVANLRVMGTYPIDKPAHVLTMLEDALSVKARKILPWWTTLESSE